MFWFKIHLQRYFTIERHYAKYHNYIQIMLIMLII